jgi:hypothetical protein
MIYSRPKFIRLFLAAQPFRVAFAQWVNEQPGYALAHENSRL